MLVAPTSVFANTINNQNIININEISARSGGYIIADGVVLNSSLGSNNVWLGLLYTGDIVGVDHVAYDVTGRKFLYVRVFQDGGKGNEGKWGYVYADYVSGEGMY